jgi:D-alanyl-D-alanine carboxypeptidase/D-alanyl-D-alanine-endopeptidase (penicillin-binding protein 4)
MYRNYYGTGSSALNWRENQFRLFLSPGLAVGDPVTLVYVDHPPPSVTLINELITSPSGSGNRTDLYLAPDGTVGYLRGTLNIDLAKNVSIAGAIPNSAVYIADELRQGMRWSSATPIIVIYQKEVNPTNRTTLDIYQSPPMSEIIYWFEQVGINMYGEALVKTIAQATNSNINSVLPTYCENEHGIEQTAVATMDGSGLSPENRITTWAIARVLYNVQQRASWFPSFERALPTINGIRMKSGYVHNALSYAGYVNNQVFSIITNNFNGQTATMRQKVWNLLDTLK